MRIHDHAACALGQPDLIDLGEGLYVLRFESMKVASAEGAVRSVLRDGKVCPGGTVVDSSSGIYAHALALACHRHGLRCHIVGSTTVDPTLVAQLRLLGATVERMPSSDSLRLDQHRRVGRIQQLLAENPGWYWMQQYHCSRHYEGYRPLGDATYTALADAGHGERIRLVAAVGSGASSAGLGEGMRAAGADVEIVGVQPFGSVTFGSADVPDPDMLIAGIGSSIEFRNVRPEIFAAVHWVSFEVARAGARDALRQHGLFAGLSTGACWAVARYEHGGHRRRDGDDGRGCDSGRGSRRRRGSRRGLGNRRGTQDGDGREGKDSRRATVFVAPDTGHRYLHSVFEGPDSQLGDFQPSCVDEGGRGLPELPWSMTRHPERWAG
ncbi:pyridoxal-phosphate dependent enzyme [Corynebacterium heidelbergense]|uniref:pyridoxal-phosphate dependent enzyme n=1 Tax=Corynebacterium heidelbergense TaxID=2055947 RepID=UPI001EE6E8BD|nr:pyridoxal-phosphate dependent enzyme [Corynebacterium heidelbergense]